MQQNYVWKIYQKGKQKGAAHQGGDNRWEQVKPTVAGLWTNEWPKQALGAYPGVR